MPDEPLISYAQNGEDIVLWRGLGHIRDGIYVDVGGWEPDLDSVTRLFYDRGWRGVDVEPIPELAEKFRQRRPDNEVVQAVITDNPVERRRAAPLRGERAVHCRRRARRAARP